MQINPFRPQLGPYNVTAGIASATQAVDVGHRTGGKWVSVLVINKDTTNAAYILWVTSASGTVSATTGLYIPEGFWGTIAVPGDTTHIAHIRAGASDADLQFWIGDGS